MAEDRAEGAADAGCVIALPERVDLVAAARLREACLACAGDITIDAGSVILATSPAFQVLMAARDRQRSLGRGLALARASAGFAACATTLGVSLDRLVTRGAPA